MVLIIMSSYAQNTSWELKEAYAKLQEMIINHPLTILYEGETLDTIFYELWLSHEWQLQLYEKTNNDKIEYALMINKISKKLVDFKLTEDLKREDSYLQGKIIEDDYLPLYRDKDFIQFTRSHCLTKVLVDVHLDGIDHASSLYFKDDEIVINNNGNILTSFGEEKIWWKNVIRFGSYYIDKEFYGFKADPDQEVLKLIKELLKPRS